MTKTTDNPNQLFSPACERNQGPILEQLTLFLRFAGTVLEIGSGTGQHAVYFARHLSHLTWQTSDRTENHPSILAWLATYEEKNLLPPFTLDVAQSQWPVQVFDAAFSANTCHIMAWSEVAQMFQGVSEVLSSNGIFIIYGPFNYDGQFTSSSNQAFDAALRLQAPHRGIRDIADMRQLALETHMHLTEDIAMPANNRLLIFSKDES
jgi:cyclopropane fatty-acyl-phospholipid synthase-like methyltransferase